MPFVAPGSFRSRIVTLPLALSLTATLLTACGEPTPDPATPAGATTGAPATTAAAANTASAAETAAPTATPAAPATSAPATSAPATPATTATASAAPAADADPPEELEVTIHVKDLEKSKTKWIYNADGRRQTARYDVYEFDFAELAPLLAANEKAEELTLKVLVTSRKQRTSMGDPDGPHPSGGFIYDTRTCKIVKLVSKK